MSFADEEDAHSMRFGQRGGGFRALVKYMGIDARLGIQSALEISMRSTDGFWVAGESTHFCASLLASGEMRLWRNGEPFFRFDGWLRRYASGERLELLESGCAFITPGRLPTAPLTSCRRSDLQQTFLDTPGADGNMLGFELRDDVRDGSSELLADVISSSGPFPNATFGKNAIGGYNLEKELFAGNLSDLTLLSNVAVGPELALLLSGARASPQPPLPWPRPGAQPHGGRCGLSWLLPSSMGARI